MKDEDCQGNNEAAWHSIQIPYLGTTRYNCVLISKEIAQVVLADFFLTCGYVSFLEA